MGESVFFSFPAFGGCLHSLAHGPSFVFRTCSEASTKHSLSDLPLSSTSERPSNYLRATLTVC